MPTWAQIRASFAKSRRSIRAKGGPPKPDPGVICPYLKTPWGERFRCFVHRNPQAQADNDFVCKKLCLPRGGPFKQALKPRGIPTGGRQPVVWLTYLDNQCFSERESS